jgi:hypothetical protein
MSETTFLATYTLAGSLGMVGAVLLGLHKALRDARWPAAERRRTVAVTAAVLLAWLAATVTLAWLGAYRGGGDRTPTIQFGILVPILVGAFLIRRSASVARILEAVPQQWLVGIQLYRVLGFIFVVLWIAGRLPSLFALPAGLGDLAVGLLAPLVAWQYARSPAAGEGAVVAWNAFGLADLLVALATGFMTAPSPFQVFAFDAPNVLIDAFPLVLIPVFLVPLSVVLHIASLTKLRRQHLPTSPSTVATAAQP